MIGPRCEGSAPLSGMNTSHPTGLWHGVSLDLPLGGSLEKDSDWLNLSRYLSLDQSPWPTWGHMAHLWQEGGGLGKKGEEAGWTDRVPQAQYRCNHGNGPGIGSTRRAPLWPGGSRALPCSASEAGPVPPSPAPCVSRSCYFLATAGIYFEKSFGKIVTCTCKRSRSYKKVGSKSTPPASLPDPTGLRGCGGPLSVAWCWGAQPWGTGCLGSDPDFLSQRCGLRVL